MIHIENVFQVKKTYIRKNTSVDPLPNRHTVPIDMEKMRSQQPAYAYSGTIKEDEEQEAPAEVQMLQNVSTMEQAETLMLLQD